MNEKLITTQSEMSNLVGMYAFEIKDQSLSRIFYVTGKADATHFILRAISPLSGDMNYCTLYTIQEMNNMVFYPDEKDIDYRLENLISGDDIITVTELISKKYSVCNHDPIIESLFDSYKCRHNDLKKFGNWVVNEDGDIINIKYSYPIYSYHFDKEVIWDGEKVTGIERWSNVIMGKKWGNEEIDSFYRAFGYAKDKAISNHSKIEE